MVVIKGGLDGLQLITLHLDLKHRATFDEGDLLLDRVPHDHEPFHLLQDGGSLEPRREEKADMFRVVE